MRDFIKKKKGIGIRYSITTCIFCIALLCVLIKINTPYTILIILLMAIGIFILCGMTIQYYRDPHVYATIDDENNLFLSNGEKIEPFDILHCRYEKARNRYYHFSYGRIVLETKKGTFVFKYVEECEKIYDKIMKMMYEAKQEEKKNIDENFENSIKM